jgi:hypothetical protein
MLFESAGKNVRTQAAVKEEEGEATQRGSFQVVVSFFTQYRQKH